MRIMNRKAMMINNRKNNNFKCLTSGVTAHTKDPLSMAGMKALDDSHLQMALSTKVSSRKVNFTGKAHLCTPKEENIRLHGSEARS